LVRSWRGTKDSFHIYLDPKLIAAAATKSFEHHLPRTAKDRFF
jgi:hypothetical protein